VKVSTLENWPNPDLRNADKVLSASKENLVVFCRSLVGGSWTHLRRQTKEALACEIVNWAMREKAGYLQIKNKDL